MKTRSIKLNIPVLPLFDKLFQPKVEDLLEEVAFKNYVDIAVYRGISKESAINKRYKKESHEQSSTVAQLPMLWKADAMRQLSGRKSIYVKEAMKRYDAEYLGAYPNLRTNIGYDWCAKQLSGAGSTAVAVTSQVAQWIALSNNTTAPAATSASSTVPWSSNQSSNAAASGTTGEITFNGLARAAGTPTHAVTGPASATTSYSLAKTFTSTTSVISAVQLAGLFGGTTSSTFTANDNTGNMLFLSTAFTATDLQGASGDQLALTWTVNI